MLIPFAPIVIALGLKYGHPLLVTLLGGIASFEHTNFPPPTLRFSLK